MQKSKHTLTSGLVIGLLLAMLPLTGQTETVCDETSWNNVIPPTQQAKLLNWLNNKRYKENFLAEPSIHPSSIHGDAVRTYYNPILVNDLAADKTVFSKGAAMVKELYDGDTVTGYAVMVKTIKRKTGTQNKDWTYYETFSSDGEGAYYGKGLSLCAGCHKKGTDFLRSDFRP